VRYLVLVVLLGFGACDRYEDDFVFLEVSGPDECTQSAPFPAYSMGRDPATDCEWTEPVFRGCVSDGSTLQIRHEWNSEPITIPEVEDRVSAIDPKTGVVYFSRPIADELERRGDPVESVLAQRGSLIWLQYMVRDHGYIAATSMQYLPEMPPPSIDPERWVCWDAQ